tara:strand:+ start:14974 stop:17178 length:2205 start_codon:yes stop_codon:yes gene_type:complete
MGGGLLNLIAEGKEDRVLIGNPSMSFFKKIYSSYTNFGRQKFRIDFEGTTKLSNNSSSVFTFKIPRYADLLQETFFVFNLPNIWSPMISLGGVVTAYCSACRTNVNTDITGFNGISTNKFKNTCVNCGSECTTDISWNTSSNPQDGLKIINQVLPFEFKWIENIGVQVIKSVKLLANDTLLQEFTGQYLLNMVYRDFSDAQKELFNRMIGNTKDLNDPANFSNRNGNYPNAAYFASMSVLNDKMPYGLEPSIRGKQIYVPLNFWSTLNNKTPIPLVSMQYTELKVQIELRPINEWWVVKDVINGITKNPLFNFYYNNPSNIKFDSHNPKAPKDPNDNPYNSDTLFQLNPSNELLEQERNLLDEFNLITQYFTLIPQQYISPQCNLKFYNMKYFLKEPPPKIITDKDKDLKGSQIPEMGALPYPFEVDEVIQKYYDEVPQVWFPDIHLIGTYTFLSDDEQKQFATKCQSYLIKEVHEQDIFDLLGGDNFTSIESQGLVVSWMWYFQRSDISERNEWSNYSNYRYNNQKGDNAKSIYGYVDQKGFAQKPFLGKINNIVWQPVYQVDQEKTILNDWGFNLDTTVRETRFNKGIIAWIDRYSRSKGSGIDGVYYYNFCLNTDPFLYQPTGAINISKFSNVYWTYSLIDPQKKTQQSVLTTGTESPIFASVSCNPLSNNINSFITNTDINSYKSKLNYTITKDVKSNYQWCYTLHIMEERYNILQVENGIASLVFSRTI